MVPQGTHYDATLEFLEKLNDPSRWVIRPGVPIFKAHERTDPATGQLIQVDLAKLHRIAANINNAEAAGGPISLSIGHTSPDKKEAEQPPIGGYYRNARVQPFGPKQEPAVVVDEWLDPQYAPVRKNFPYRSAEYYDDTESITKVALLTRDPYLDLGVVAYAHGNEPLRYRVDESHPTVALHYSNGVRRPTAYNLVIGEPMFPQVPNPAVGQPTPLWTGPAVPFATPPVPQPFPNPAYQAMPVTYNAQPVVYGVPQAQPVQYLTPHAPTNYNPALLAGLMGAGARGGAMALGSQMMGGMGGGGGGQPPEHNSRYSAPWPGPVYHPTNLKRPHVNHGAIYNREQTQYDEPHPGGPPGGGMQPGGPPGGESPMGPGGDPLQQLQMLLMAAVEVLSQVTGGGGPGGPPPMGPGGPPEPPSGPFPGAGGPPGQFSRMGGGRQAPRQYSNPGVPMFYGYPQQRRTPVPYGAAVNPYYGLPPQAPPQPPMRTLGGRPVAYEMELAKLNYQLAQSDQAMRVLYYERDQADTQACVEAIRSLANVGFPVGQEEVHELKRRRPGDDRQIYLDTIATKYQKIGTQPLPPILGDPTPAAPPESGPASKDMMEAALKITANDPRITYQQALQYARTGQLPTQYGAPQQYPQWGQTVPGQAGYGAPMGQGF
jgi:hypothetical protein